MAKKNTSDLRGSSSGNSPSSFFTIDDGNQPASDVAGSIAEYEVSLDSEEDREAIRATKKDVQAEGYQGNKNDRSSTTQGSSTADSKEWAQEEVIKGPKTHKHRYW